MKRLICICCLLLLPTILNAQTPQANCDPDKGEASTFKYFSAIVDNVVPNAVDNVFDIKIFQSSANDIASLEYAKYQPDPFFYKKDVDAAKLKKVSPFKIAGVNCDETILSAPTITGVSVEDLSLRARGRNPYIRSDNDEERKKLPEWQGAAHVETRASGEGFLGKSHVISSSNSENKKNLSIQKNALRKLLITDNSLARKSGLSHQEIASPILAAIEQHANGDSSDFLWQGEVFSVIAYSDGQKFFGGQPTDEPGRKDDSGWGSNGFIQGSFFDDELATAGKYYRFIRKKPKKGLPNELTIDGLTPHLIYRYGFYQNGPYRLSPETISKFFNTKATAQNPWKECNKAQK